MEFDVDIQDEQDLDLDEEQEQLVTEVDEGSEADESKEKKSQDWDRTRQDLDFERANARKARAEAETLTEALDQANAKMSHLEEQLAQLQDQKQAEQDKLDEMDPDLVPEGVAKNIETLNRRLQETTKRLEETQQKVTRYEQEQTKAEEQRRQEEVRSSVFDTVETALSEAGIKGAGKYRTEANKLADQLVDSGQESQPRTMATAVKLMTKCYLQVKKAQDSKTKTKSASKVSTDTGKSGATPESTGKPSGLKPGRLSDVKAQMLKNQSWKG